MSALELGAMLKVLFDDGWKPALLAEPTSGTGPAARWVCFPQGEVRAYAAFRDPDPAGAVRQLYTHALSHPNLVPTFPPPVSSALDQRRAACVVRCPDYTFGARCPCVARGFLSPHSDPLPMPAPWIQHNGA
jgi:hypothetical protein